MERSRSKQFVSFILQSILGTMMKSCAILHSPVQDMHHPFVLHLHPIYVLPVSHLVATSVIGSIIRVSSAPVQVTLILLHNGPNAQER